MEDKVKSILDNLYYNALFRMNNSFQKEDVESALRQLDELELSEGEIEKIVNEHCQGIVHKDNVMLVYGNVAHAIHEAIITKRGKEKRG